MGISLQVRNDHEKRLSQLQAALTKSELRALVIEMHLGVVDKAIDIINSCVATGMDWNKVNESYRSTMNIYS